MSASASHDHPELEKLARFAAEVARWGGELARSQIGRVQPERKGDRSVVTEADRAAQEAIFTAISARYPAHALLGEESGSGTHGYRGGSNYCWVVDPIDGTRNYARGVECYVTSVGVLLDGLPVAGALYEPPRDRMFIAWRGGGAWMISNATGDSPSTIRLPSLSDLPINPDTTIAVSTINNRPAMPQLREWIEKYIFRNAGSLCTHLIWVALGWVDGAYSQQAKLWDIVAGAVLIKETGGRFTRPDGSPMWPVDPATYAGVDLPLVTGRATFHAELLRSLMNGK